MEESDIIYTYLAQVVKNEDLVEFEIKTPEKGGKGDGYLGKIIFVTIHGTTKKGNKKVLNLVVKTPTMSNALREQIPVGGIFHKESLIYNEVIPVFKTFQKKFGLNKDLLEFVPHCYLTDASEKREFIILQNLKSLGFDLWDRLKPMPYDYISLVLESLGKWHAFSFAMKDKEPENFEKLLQAHKLNMSYHSFRMKFTDAIFKYLDEVRNASICRNNVEISNKLKITKSDTEYTFGNMFFEDPDNQVITHGDCWTNNLMFKLDDNKRTPTSVSFFDWQLSAVASPIMDVSYFIYTCVDTEIYSDLKELLDIYYRSLSDCLSQFGCDSSQIFPYETLLKHWQRFSSFGILLGTLVLKFSLSDVGEAPDFAEAADSGMDVLDSFEFTIANEDYHKRVKNNFLHYVRNLEPKT